VERLMAAGEAARVIGEVVAHEGEADCVIVE
jgi:hypothetical protein